MGSPEFAVPILRRVSGEYNIVGVVTQPDRPSGRGRVITPPPVKLLANELGLRLIQPHRLTEPESFIQLQEWAPDLIIVAAFGQILRPAVLDLPNFGCINVHASILPRWRGAAPIQAAILNGDEKTGITIMRMDPGIDTGPILRQKAIPILNNDNAGTLSIKLSKLAATLLLDTLPDYLSGKLKPQPQDDAIATYAPMIKKEQGLLDFSTSAQELSYKIRAFDPWPGAFCNLEGQMLKLRRAHPIDAPGGTPGKRIIYQGLPAFETGRGVLVLDELQLAGRKAQFGKNFLLGWKDWEICKV
jgi:methionyl-tRNA formyltransferase